MQIQVSTDHNIDGHENLVAETKATVTNSLKHLSARITRVEVHLTDNIGDRDGPNDMRCMIEARVEGRRPIAVTCEAPTVAQAVAGAASKLKSSLQTTLGQLHEHR